VLSYKSKLHLITSNALFVVDGDGYFPSPSNYP